MELQLTFNKVSCLQLSMDSSHRFPSTLASLLGSSFRSPLQISLPECPARQHHLLPCTFFSRLFYSTSWGTSIIFAWKLFINLPVKHSIEPFTSYYRNLLGTYWQLSKYLHKALKHSAPSEEEAAVSSRELSNTFSSTFSSSSVEASFPLAQLQHAEITLLNY